MMLLSIDISGQITQLNYDSVIGCKKSNGIWRTVYLRSKVKKNLLRKYKGQVTRLPEKVHCILIYYCIKDLLENVEEIKICKDINYRVLKQFLPLLFKDRLSNINLNIRKGSEPQTNGHRPALRAFRRKKYASEFISESMIERMLFKFKE